MSNIKNKLLPEGSYIVYGTPQDSITLEDLKDLQSPIIDISPKQEAMRFNNDKLRFDLIPIEIEIELARVYTMGSYKYEDWNWEKGMPYSKCIASLERHWKLWKAGLEVDSDTGCHHLSQVVWNATSLLVYQLRGLGKDDRRKYAIDEKFNLLDNKLGIGLSDEQITELKNKYKDKK